MRPISIESPRAFLLGALIITAGALLVLVGGPENVEGQQPTATSTATRTATTTGTVTTTATATSTVTGTPATSTPTATATFFLGQGTPNVGGGILPVNPARTPTPRPVTADPSSTPVPDARPRPPSTGDGGLK